MRTIKKDGHQAATSLTSKKPPVTPEVTFPLYPPPHPLQTNVRHLEFVNNHVLDGERYSLISFVAFDCLKIYIACYAIVIVTPISVQGYMHLHPQCYDNTPPQSSQS